MATTIQVKRSTSVTDTAMASNTLAYGELAYSFHATTNKLWIGNNSNVPTTIGGSYFTTLFHSDIIVFSVLKRVHRRTVCPKNVVDRS